jgi:5,5'-dehydrodivanillate O-demethylase
MLSAEKNQALTAVGKGTPMGELMRRYWHPIAAVAELDERPTKSVRLQGEDLVLYLYRDRSGTLGLIDKLCPHRRVDMSCRIGRPSIGPMATATSRSQCSPATGSSAKRIR